MAGELDLWQVVATLRERLPEDAIVASGAGNSTVWLHRLYRHRRFRTQLAPYVGSMGYGVPAAIAAKATHPERVVLSWNGDGCFQMNGQEIHRGSIQAECHFHGHRQRNARDHPHASGAQLSGAGVRY